MHLKADRGSIRKRRWKVRRLILSFSMCCLSEECRIKKKKAKYIKSKNCKYYPREKNRQSAVIYYILIVAVAIKHQIECSIKRFAVI